jgi:hypothetical protein
MYQNAFMYAESRVQELRNAKDPAFGRQIAVSNLGRQVRQGTGEALIALGSWIKSGSQNTNLTPFPSFGTGPARLGGR